MRRLYYRFPDTCVNKITAKELCFSSEENPKDLSIENSSACVRTVLIIISRSRVPANSLRLFSTLTTDVLL